MMALGGWCCFATHSLLLHTLSAALEEKKVIADGAAAANGADGYQKPPPRVMICNRGEIARRVIRTANQHGLETVAIYTQVGWVVWCAAYHPVQGAGAHTPRAVGQADVCHQPGPHADLAPPAPRPAVVLLLLLPVGAASLAVQVDSLAPHVREAKHAVYLGSNPRDYTNKEKLLQVCWGFGGPSLLHICSWLCSCVGGSV